MKSIGLRALLIFFILISCQNDDETKNLQAELTLAEIKLKLANRKNDNNLIKHIEPMNESHVIQFESGESLMVPSLLIKEIEYDSLQWQVTFIFYDDSNQTSNFIGRLGINQDDIVLNPYLTAPLVALAEFTTPVKGRFKVTVKGKKPNGITISMGVTIGKSFDYYGESHRLPILGLYENHANEIEFVFMNRDGQARCSKIISIQTPTLTNKPILEIEIPKNQLSDEYNGLYLISNLKIGFDQTGAIRWFYNGEGASFFGKLRNGNFLVSESSNLAFLEVTMLGQRVKKYHVPDGLHHEIVELPNGNFLVASHSPPGAPLEDVIVEVSRSSGMVIKSWDFKTILDPLRTPLPDVQRGDWLHINALYYDESDQSIVISGRSQCVVVKIDYNTGALKWILGNHNQWEPSFTPFLLKPVDDMGREIDTRSIDFWNYGQHAIQRLPGGNLLLYDNGTYRGFYDDNSVPADNYTRVVEYKINEHQKTVELVWQFDSNKSVFTKFTGYTQHLSNTRLVAYMWASENSPRLVEIDEKGQIVYDAFINRAKASYFRTSKLDVYDSL